MSSQFRRSSFVVGAIIFGLLAARKDQSVKAETRRPRESMRVILYRGTDVLLLLTDEQQAKFDKINAEIQAVEAELAAIVGEPAGNDFESHLREFRSRARKRLEDVLTIDQWQRLSELSFQGKARGIPSGLIIKKKGLGFSPDQLKSQSELQSIAEIQADILQHAVHNGELPENSKTARQIRVDCERMMLEVLTPEQRAKLDKMKGDRP
jgi:hypothetical protein